MNNEIIEEQNIQFSKQDEQKMKKYNIQIKQNPYDAFGYFGRGWLYDIYNQT